MLQIWREKERDGIITLLTKVNGGGGNYDCLTNAWHLDIETWDYGRGCILIFAILCFESLGVNLYADADCLRHGIRN